MKKVNVSLSAAVVLLAVCPALAQQPPEGAAETIEALKQRVVEQQETIARLTRELGEAAIYENRIQPWINLETLEVIMYRCSDIRLVVRQEPRLAKEDAVNAMRRIYPHLFEGCVPPANEESGDGWAPPDSKWRGDAEVRGPTLYVIPKPGDINTPIIHWYTAVLCEGQWVHYLNAETGEGMSDPMEQWVEYNKKDSKDK